MAAASKQIGSAEANVASVGLVLWRDRSSAPLWPCGAGGQPRPVVVHRRVGALWIAAGRLANEIWVVSQFEFGTLFWGQNGLYILLHEHF